MYQKYLNNFDINFGEFSAYFIKQNCIIQPKNNVFSNIAHQFSLTRATETEMLEYFDLSFHQFSERFDHVLEAFNFLKKEGVKTACVTNGRDFFQRNKIAALGLQDCFDVILTSGELGIKKPDTMIFNTALSKLGATANECVFIGDSIKADMEPAKSLGMTTLWKTAVTDKIPAVVDYTFNSFADFPAIWKTLTQNRNCN